MCEHWACRCPGNKPGGAIVAEPGLKGVDHQKQVESESYDDGSRDDQPPFPASTGCEHSEDTGENRARYADGRAPLAVGRDEDAQEKSRAGDTGFCRSFHEPPPRRDPITSCPAELARRSNAGTRSAASKRRLCSDTTAGETSPSPLRPRAERPS